MKLVEVIETGENGFYVMKKPACSPDSRAYKQWEGFIVEKVMGTAIRVTDPKGVRSISSGDCLPLCGLAIRSDWTKIEDHEV